MATKKNNLKTGLHVPAHRVFAPTTVSPEARSILSKRHAPDGPKQPSGIEDKDAWRAYIKKRNRFLRPQMAMAARFFPAEIITHQLSRTPLYEIIPRNLSPAYEDCVIIYIHGGAFILGAGLAGAYMGFPLAGAAQMRSYAVDYRMPPDHPFPAGLDDTIDAYRIVLEKFNPEKIVVVGNSAGGGLAASFVLKARDIGLPLPGLCVLDSPEADLTESGDTFETNIFVDVALTERLTDSIMLYANGHDLRDPYLSPLFGDFSKGFSPTMLISGTRDLFLSNTVMMHRALLRAGIEAELHVWEAMPHGGFWGAPEDREVLCEQVRFIQRRLKK